MQKEKFCLIPLTGRTWSHKFTDTESGMMAVEKWALLLLLFYGDTVQSFVLER